MSPLLAEFARLSPLLAWAAIVTALTLVAAVLIERGAIAILRAWRRRTTRHYSPLVRRAVAGDLAARDELVASPARHRLVLTWLLIEPLIEDRDPERIAGTRAVAEALSLLTQADRYLRSRRWWRRALALRALGLVQARSHTARIVVALDDANADVRAAALDALADLRDPAALQAIVVRVHDTSLHRGRRGAALKAFGAECEPFLLELARLDPPNRLNYIHAVAICGSARSLPALREWTADTRLEVRATAFQAMAFVGLDDETARVALEGLESEDAPVRAMAAHALRGWQGPGDAPARLARHLDDTWAVAVQAARTLRSMGPAGALELQAHASSPDLAGLLARQMLWPAGADQ